MWDVSFLSVVPAVSEDTHSADLALQEQEDRGFYTETFYSIAWIFWGDDDSSEPIRANLSTRTRPISSKISSTVSGFPHT